jgi:mono/diheme cytochrome c family protein
MRPSAFLLLAPALTLAGALSAASAVQTLYQQRCAKCHGLDGDGHGKAAVLLDPKPTDFTSPAWQAKRVDAQIVDDITNGHDAKQHPSKKMPYFGTRYSRVEIEALVTVVRSFKKP